MPWIYLFIAGCFEIGWPLGFKLSQITSHRALYIGLAIVSMAFSGLFLCLAQKQISIGTAYAIWTGIGAAGTFLVGILFFDDPVRLTRFLSFTLILFGVIGLRLSH